MKISTLLSVAMLLPVALSLAQDRAAVSLSCTIPSGQPVEDIVRPRSAVEDSRIQQNSHDVKRIGRHQLSVTWAGGIRVFKDKPPFDAELDGVWWAYCGYSATLKMHLLMKKDVDLFTGVLLDDVTGALLPGGENVMFSSDGKLYVATEQQDGMDGEIVKLLTRQGTLVWKGYGGVLTKDGGVLAELGNFRWDKNRLIGDDEISKKIFALTQVNVSSWKWVPLSAK